MTEQTSFHIRLGAPADDLSPEEMARFRSAVVQAARDHISFTSWETTESVGPDGELIVGFDFDGIPFHEAPPPGGSPEGRALTNRIVADGWKRFSEERTGR